MKPRKGQKRAAWGGKRAGAGRKPPLDEYESLIVMSRYRELCTAEAQRRAADALDARNTGADFAGESVSELHSLSVPDRALVCDLANRIAAGEPFGEDEYYPDAINDAAQTLANRLKRDADVTRRSISKAERAGRSPPAFPNRLVAPLRFPRGARTKIIEDVARWATTYFGRPVLPAAVESALRKARAIQRAERLRNGISD